LCQYDGQETGNAEVCQELPADARVRCALSLCVVGTIELPANECDSKFFGKPNGGNPPKPQQSKLAFSTKAEGKGETEASKENEDVLDGVKDEEMVDAGVNGGVKVEDEGKLIPNSDAWWAVGEAPGAPGSITTFMNSLHDIYCPTESSR
jgi:hypothetical protein